MTPRIRMIAGPNGSGKSTVIEQLRRKSIWLGLYLNADDIEAGLRLLRAALKVCDRAFIFDNSGHEIVYVAEQQDGRIVTTGASVPSWLQRALRPGL